jgi:hypothetical protein
MVDSRVLFGAEAFAQELGAHNGYPKTIMQAPIYMYGVQSQATEADAFAKKLMDGKAFVSLIDASN